MSPVAIILIVVGALVVLAIAGVGVFAAIGMYGARRYINTAKEAEGRTSAQVLALGIVRCAEQETLEGKSELLPDTAPAVPGSLSDVSGRKYMSSTTDWSAPAYTCATFAMSTPQYFQYQWVKESSTAGVVRAIADFNGDGSADVTFEVPVTCTGKTCSTGAIAKR